MHRIRTASTTSCGESIQNEQLSLPPSLSLPSLSPGALFYWVWPARTGGSVNAAQSGRSALACDAQSHKQSDRVRRGQTRKEGRGVGVRRPLSHSRVPPPPEDGALEENALPWRLTPICHCSSITDHPAAPEQAADYSPPPADTVGHARRRANKYNAILFIFTHWGGTSGALRKRD